MTTPLPPRVPHPTGGLGWYILGAGIMAVVADGGPVRFLLVAVGGVILTPLLNGVAAGFRYAWRIRRAGYAVVNGRVVPLNRPEDGK